MNNKYSEYPVNKGDKNNYNPLTSMLQCYSAAMLQFMNVRMIECMND